MSINLSEEFILNLYESMLRVQINTLKQIRKGLGLKDKEATKGKRKSQIDMVYDILVYAQQPMHVNDIIVQIEKRFGPKLDKDSLVSALTKRVMRQDRFTKTAPNTFTLIAQELGGGEK